MGYDSNLMMLLLLQNNNADFYLSDDIWVMTDNTSEDDSNIWELRFYTNLPSLICFGLVLD